MAGLVFGGDAPPPARTTNLMHPAGNAYDIAITAWLDAQLNVCDYRDLQRDEARLWERILNGRGWMMRNNASHPRHERNAMLLAQLEWDRTLTMLYMDDRLTAIRYAVWTIWVCWQSMSSTERITLAWETGLKNLEGPETVWDRLELDDVSMGRLPVTERRSWLPTEQHFAEWERA